MNDETKETVEVIENTEQPINQSTSTNEPETYDMKKGFQGLSDQMTEQLSAFFTDLMSGIKQLLNKEDAKPDKVIEKDNWI